jgi:hypothetical protein
VTRLRLAAAAAALVAGLTPTVRAGAPACPPQVFISAIESPAGFEPWEIAVGRFNADAIPDVALGRSSTFEDSLSILLGNGDGTFGEPTVFDSGDIEHLVAADFNGDGFDDLAVDYSSQYAGILISNGDGTFQPIVLYGGLQHPQGFLAADLTGNGTLDLVLSSSDAQAFVLPGNGDGTFDAGFLTGTAGSAIAVGDVDGDGTLDLVSTFQEFVSVSTGNGDRTFNPGSFYAVAPQLRSIAVADVNGDGLGDVGVAIDDYAEVIGGYVGVMIANADGTLQAAVETPVGSETRTLLFADLDDDGAVDAVAIGDGFVNVLRGNHTASMEVPTPYVVATPFDLALGDFDSDGNLDVAAASRYAAAVSVLLGYGDGTLQASTGLGFRGVLGIADFSVADFDADALGDLLVSNSGAGLEVYRGLGDGRFAVEPIVLQEVENPGSNVAADFDGDGHPDAAVLNGGGALVSIVMNAGDGTFLPPVESFVPSFQYGLIAADFDGNGTIDLASVSNFNGGRIGVLLGNGDGTFDGPFDTPVPDFPQSATVAMLNGDGLADLVVLGDPESSNGILRALLSNGDGTFTESASYDLPFYPYGVAAGNVAGDAATDLVVADGGGGLMLFVGNGDGTFQAPSNIPIDFFPTGVVLADFDGDGLGDLVAEGGGAQFSPAVVYLPGLGGGSFGPPIEFPVVSGVIGMKSVVLSGTAPSVALASYEPARLSFLLNSRLTAAAADASVIVGTAAVLHASASGTGPITFQWRKDGMPLADGGRISGSQTAALTIDPVDFTDAGAYDVLVSDACDSATSNSAVLSVEFADVPVTSPFHGDILEIATAGITAGCGGGNYCPTLPVRRDQMAVFLLKSEHGAAYDPPPCTPGVFSDVACPGPFADWIQQLAAEGITAGCGAGIYCPSQPVTRAQMAVFLLKTKDGSGYTPPPATGIFGDVPPGSFAAAFIEELYHRGITGGCSASPLLYCPGSSVLRQQMATFLVRTFTP